MATKKTTKAGDPEPSTSLPLPYGGVVAENQIIHMKNSEKGFSTWYNNRFEELRDAAQAYDDAGDDATETHRAAIRSALDRFQGQWDRRLDNLQKLQLSSPENWSKYQPIIVELTDNAKDIIDGANDRLVALDRKFSTAGAQPAVQPPAGAATLPVIKLENTFKPKPLAPEASAVDLEEWRSDMANYFANNNLQTLTQAQQLSYWLQCLSKTVRDDIHAKIKAVDPALPVYHATANCCDRILVTFWETRYSIFKRRQDAHKIRFRSGETAAAFLRRILKYNDIARLHEMNRDEIAIHMFVAKYPDTILLDKIELDHRHDNLENLLSFLDAWDSRSSQTKASSGQLNQIQRSGWQKVQRREKSVGKRFLCVNCNDSRAPARHLTRQCPAALKQMQCKGCPGKGHFHFSVACPNNKSRSQRLARENRRPHSNRRRESRSPPSSSTPRAESTSRESRPRTRHPQRETANSVSRDSSAAESSATNAVGFDANMGPFAAQLNALYSLGDGKFVTSSNNKTAIMNAEIRPVANSPGKPFRVAAIADTGCCITVASWDVMKYFGYKPVVDGTVPRNLRVANNQKINILGCCQVFIDFDGLRTPLTVAVSDDLQKKFFVSVTDLKEMKVIPADFPSVLTSPTYANSITPTSDSVKPTSDELWLQREIEKLRLKYSEVFSSTKTPMHGEPFRFDFNVPEENIKPVRQTRTRATPIHLRPAADKVLNELLDSGILVPVKDDEVSQVDFITPGFFIWKADGVRARLLTDMRNVNKYCRTFPHPILSPRDVIKAIKPTSKFAVSNDLADAYFSIPVDDEHSKRYLTILLEQGLFRFTRLTQGLSVSSSAFTSRSDRYINSRLIPDCVKLVDDVLLQASTKEELLRRVELLFQQCKSGGIQLNPLKFRVADLRHHDLPFAGLLINSSGCKPTLSKIRAIKDFPPPTNLTELRRWNGLLTQLSLWIGPDLSLARAPYNALLRKNSPFIWTPECQYWFDETKKLLVENISVCHYDPSRENIVVHDGSKKGLGYVFLQKDETGKNYLIACGSRSVQPAETRYGASEIELLSLEFCLNDLRYYLIGSPNPIKVYTDHSALKNICAANIMDLKTTRLMRIMEKILDFNIEVIHFPGRQNLVADALSRAPLAHPTADVSNFNSSSLTDLFGLDDDFDNHIYSDPLLEPLIKAAAADKDYQQCISALRSFTDFHEIPTLHPARVLKKFWSDCSIFDDSLILVGKRIFIPQASRSDILQLLHRGHPGVKRMLHRANDYYFWPSMSAQVKSHVENCELCMTNRNSKPSDPIKSDFIATESMENISLDFCHFEGKNFLVIVDRFSSFPFVYRMKTMTSKAVIDRLKDLFAFTGNPLFCETDGAKMFTSEEFLSFLRDHHIIAVNSSPYFPRSNGKIERMVQDVKRMLERSHGVEATFRMHLSHYRNTPRGDGRMSPSEMFFGRRFRLDLPEIKKTQQDLVQWRERILDSKENLAFKNGQNVRVQNPLTGKWTQKGQIIGIRAFGRSFFVQIGDRIFVRNKKFLKSLPSPAFSSEKKNSPPAKEKRSSSGPPVSSPPPLRRSPRLNSVQEHPVSSTVKSALRSKKNFTPKKKQLSFSRDSCLIEFASTSPLEDSLFYENARTFSTFRGWK